MLNSSHRPGAEERRHKRERAKAWAVWFGRLVRARRLELGWSLERLAFKIGADPSTVGRIERGRLLPRFETVVALAEAFSLLPASPAVTDLLGLNSVLDLSGRPDVVRVAQLLCHCAPERVDDLFNFLSGVGPANRSTSNLGEK